MSSVIIPNGNICLTFEDSVSRLLTKFANKYFCDVADGYLIGPDSIPHLTLCHIHHDKPQPRALRRDLGAIRVKPDPLILDTLVQHDAQDGYIWMRFDLGLPAPWMLDLKSQVEAVLTRYEVTVLKSDFQPHVSVCRIKAPIKAVGTDAMKFKMAIDPGQLLLSIGGSDKLGQLPKVYWKQALA